MTMSDSITRQDSVTEFAAIREINSSLRTRLVVDSGCQVCAFQLWKPISESIHSSLGLYSDARFPGRSILSLKEHYTNLSDVPLETLTGFMRDIQIATVAIKVGMGAHRVNVAILGNRDSHVHAHLIPRFPEKEEYPDCSPWNDPREQVKLKPSTEVEIINRIYESIGINDTRQRRRNSDQRSNQLALF